MVFNLPLRQAEGFLRSLLELMGLSLEAPDHTTLSRRNQSLDVRIRRSATTKPMHLIVDSTGLDLIEQVEGRVACITADPAYDTISICDAALARGAKVVVPPPKNAVVSGRGPRSIIRDRTIRKVKKVGRRQWKKVSGYHRQGTVENAFFRYKSILRDRLRARHPMAQEAEALIACNILNRMFELGRPTSEAIRP